MTNRDLIKKLLDYNLDAEFQVIANNKVQEIEFCIGNSEGCSKENCETVSIYLKDLNKIEKG